MPYSTPTKIKLMTLLIVNSLVSALPRAKEYRGGAVEVVGNRAILAEPTCEELKAMWRFSKRQSRAAEITNEIPMYRDPFASNVWEPYYPSARRIGLQRSNRIRNRPIYGRIIHNPPPVRPQEKPERHKPFEEFARLYGMPMPQIEPARMKIATLRGTPGGGSIPSVNFPPQQGSFQHLKEIMKTERARDLQLQRANEEAAARAAVLKENQRKQASRYDHYDYTSDEEDYGRPSIGSGANINRGGGFITYPSEMLSPASRFGHVTRLVPDYTFSRNFGRFKTHRPVLFDTFNTGYSGYLQ